MGTKHKGSKKEKLALDTVIKFYRACSAFEIRTLPVINGAGLTTSQFAVLDALYHLGDLNQSELSRKILKTGGNLTMVIDNLSKQGYVERRRCTEDRRHVYVSLTEEGRALFADIFPKHAALVAKEMSVLTEEEQRELGRLCAKLGKAGDST